MTVAEQVTAASERIEYELDIRSTGTRIDNAKAQYCFTLMLGGGHQTVTPLEQLVAPDLVLFGRPPLASEYTDGKSLLGNHLQMGVLLDHGRRLPGTLEGGFHRVGIRPSAVDCETEPEWQAPRPS